MWLSEIGQIKFSLVLLALGFGFFGELVNIRLKKLQNEIYHLRTRIAIGEFGLEKMVAMENDVYEKIENLKNSQDRNA
jgi:predicted metal-dependent TIM-barrel fold hydrolase